MCEAVRVGRSAPGRHGGRAVPGVPALALPIRSAWQHPPAAGGRRPTTLAEAAMTPLEVVTVAASRPRQPPAVARKCGSLSVRVERPCPSSVSANASSSSRYPTTSKAKESADRKQTPGAKGRRQAALLFRRVLRGRRGGVCNTLREWPRCGGLAPTPPPGGTRRGMTQSTRCVQCR